MAVKKNFFVTLGITFWILTVIFALLPSWPHLYYPSLTLCPSLCVLPLYLSLSPLLSLIHSITISRPLAHLSHFLLCFQKVAQLVFDALSYFVFYSPTLAWFGHLGGYISGLTLTFTLGLLCQHRYQRVLGALGATAFALFVAFLVYHMYATPFPPPIPSYNPLLVHPFDHGDCCITAYGLMSTNRTLTMDDVRRTHYCNGDTLIARSK